MPTPAATTPAATSRGGRPPRARRPAREQTAYDTGRAGEALPAWAEESPRLTGAWEDGAADRETAGLAGREADPAAKSAASGRAGDDVAEQARTAVDWGATRRWLARRPGVSDASGFLLGLLGFALFQTYLRDGWAGVRGWLAAKFLNQPADTAAGFATPLAPALPDLPAGAIGMDEALRRFRAGERAGLGG